VEFLELLGRIAELKYKGAGMKDIPLARRLEFVLDLVIPVVLEVPRREVDIQVVEESESDDDY